MSTEDLTEAEVPICAATRGLGLYVAGGSLGANAMLVATVARPPGINDWHALFSECLEDGKEYPIYRAAKAAIDRWGGRLQVVNPAGHGDES